MHDFIISNKLGFVHARYNVYNISPLLLLLTIVLRDFSSAGCSISDYDNESVNVLLVVMRCRCGCDVPFCMPLCE